MNLGTLWAHIGLDTTKLDTGAKKAKATILGMEQIARQANQKMSQHFDSLGIRSVFDIGQEKQKIIASFNTIKSSGTSTARDIANAQSAVNKRIKELDAELKGASRSFGGLTGAAKAFGLAVSAGAILKFGASIYTAGVQMDSMTRALTAATGSAAESMQGMDYVRKEAERLGIVLPVAVQGFTKLSAAAKGTSLQGQGVRDIFSSVSAASAKLGLSADETNGALLAISQMMSKGVVSAEELRGQLGERLPGAFQAAARAMGVSTAKLGDMLQKGEIMADDFLPKFAKALNETFNITATESIESARSQLNRLSNAWLEFKLAISDSGFLDGVTTSVIALTDALQGLNNAWEFVNIPNSAIHEAEKLQNLFGELKALAKEKDVDIWSWGLWNPRALPNAQEVQQIFLDLERAGIAHEKLNKLREEYISMGVLEAPQVKGPPSPHSPGYVSKSSPAVEMKEQTEKVIKALEFERDQLTRSEEMQRVYNEIKEAGVGINTRSADTIKSLVTEIFAETEALEKNKEAQKEAEQAKKDMLKSYDDVVAKIKAYDEAVRQADTAQTIKDTEVLVDNLKGIQMELDTQGGMLGYLTDGLALYDEGIEESTENALDRMDNLNDAAKDLGFTFSSAFEDAIISGAKFSDILKGLYDDIMRILLRKTVTEPLAGGIASIIGSIGQAVIGGATSTYSGGSYSGNTNYVGGVIDSSKYSLGSYSNLSTQYRASGGVIDEHVIGIGQRTGRRWEMGENGIETVVPGLASVNKSSSEGTSEGSKEGTSNLFYISAVDAKSFEDLCKRNPHAIINQFTAALSAGDKNLKRTLNLSR